MATSSTRPSRTATRCLSRRCTSRHLRRLRPGTNMPRRRVTARRRRAHTDISSLSQLLPRRRHLRSLSLPEGMCHGISRHSRPHHRHNRIMVSPDRHTAHRHRLCRVIARSRTRLLRPRRPPAVTTPRTSCIFNNSHSSPLRRLRTLGNSPRWPRPRAMSRLRTIPTRHTMRHTDLSSRMCQHILPRPGPLLTRLLRRCMTASPRRPPKHRRTGTL